MSPEKTWTRADLPDGVVRAVDAAVDRKGRGIVVLRVTEIVGYTDWLVLVSGRSERHVAGVSDGITQALRELGLRPYASDGLKDHRWDLLDYGDFIVHVFHHPVRLHYDLESMLRDAPRVELGLPDEVMDTSDLAQTFTPDPLAADRFVATPRRVGAGDFAGFADEFGDDDADDLGDEPAATGSGDPYDPFEGP